MNTKRVLVIFALLVFVQTSYGQSNQLRTSSTRLASEASIFAESMYSEYTRSFRNTSNVDSVMLAYQFSAGAQVFNRLVNDRRRSQELMTAFQSVQNLWRSAYRSEFSNARWNNIEGLMSQISRELNYGDSGNINPLPRPFPDGDGPSTGSGVMTWRGRVDDDVRIRIRGGSAQVETIGGTPFYDAVTSFTAALPRRANVTVVKRRGRGEVFVEQQPSRQNDYTAVVRIRDSKGGADDYEFHLSW
ncbi:MAG TPA: hypothetical protein VJU86_18245 [Pyrinomonadaceae bacterium]|nr:hypothetical protein [Pyrinomonadaceae bacterium]